MAEDNFQQEEAAEESSGGGDDCPKPEDCPAGAPGWVVTFGDMMSLLLCFFILLLSFSTMDVIKYRQLVGSLQVAFGAQNSQLVSVLAGKEATTKLSSFDAGSSTLSEEELEHQLVAAVEEEGMTGDASLARTDRGIVLRVRQQVMFEHGSARILPESIPLLRKAAIVCRHFERKVYVEGHTDNIPLESSAYPSNWELSAARACAVVRFLLDTEHLPPEKFVASGLAATVPLAPNATEEGRAKNRRVEFIFSGRPGDEEE